ncbi:polyketide synthase [Mycobacterium sp. EPG1]|nr:polyketide synthase [Mycobacterium sp. EPG1]
MLPDARIPVLLTAHADALIAEDARRILGYLDRKPTLEAVAATLLRLRRRQRHRAVVRAGDLRELGEGLAALAHGADHPLITRATLAEKGRRAFVFPGQGNQWPSMGAEAYRTLSAYRTAADECAAVFEAAGQRSPLDYLTAAPGAEGWSQIDAQAAQFTHAVALSAVWRSCGIEPDLTVGHSLGEVAAACVAGMLTLADAAAVVIARAAVLENLSQGYGMVVLGVAPAAAQLLIDETGGWLELSVVNAASSVAVSGESAAVEKLKDTATERGIFARTVTMAFPAHTSLLDGLRTDLLGRLPNASFRDGGIPFIGSATGTAVPPDSDFADYWFANLRNTVRFDHAAAAAVGAGADIFIEMSAHPALLFALGQSAGDALTVGSGRRDAPIADALAAGIATVAAADPAFAWDDTVDTSTPPLRGFPNTPMRATHLWALPQPLPPAPALTLATEAWEPRDAAPATLALRRTAVLELPGPRTGLGDLLRDAVDRHLGVQAAPVDEADLVLAVAPTLDDPDATRSAHALADLIGAGLLGYSDTVGPDCRDLWLVTVAGEQVRHDETPLPGQAALAAVHRSLGFERPDVNFRHLDLPSSTPDAATVLDAVLTDGDELAVRETDDGPTVFARAEHEPGTVPELWLTDPGVLDDVVITGGNGTVGQHYAKVLARHGARRITVLSRSLGCDITDPGQVAAAAAEFGGDGATLVIHAAATARFADRDELTAQDFTDACAAKIAGITHVVEHWPLRPSARIVLCSSVSGLWGGRGHAAYAAANRMLDALAAKLRADGVRCSAARFGLFGTGIVDDAAVDRIARAGLVPMDADDAIEASLREYGGDAVIYSADRARLQVFREAPAGESAGGAAGPEDGTALVVSELASVLGVQPDTIDLTAALLDMGVDSLLALDLRKRLRRGTGRSVPLAAMLGGITGTELVAALDEQPRKNEIPA